MSKTMRFNEKVNLLSDNYSIKEQIDPKTLKVTGVKLTGLAITPDKPTRNNVSYTRESIERTYKTLIGKPFLDSHNDSSVRSSPPFGRVTNVWMEGNGLHYEVDIDPNEKIFINKAKRGDIPGVSIQVLVSDVQQKNGFVEATVSEFLELSAVLIPGDGDTSMKFAEKLKSRGFLEAFMAKCPQCDSSEQVKRFEDDVTGLRKYKCMKCGSEFGNKKEESDKKKIRMIGEIEKEIEKEKKAKEDLKEPELKWGDKFRKEDDAKELEKAVKDLNLDESDSQIKRRKINKPKKQGVILKKQFEARVDEEKRDTWLQKDVKEDNLDESDAQIRDAKKVMGIMPKKQGRILKREQDEVKSFGPEDRKVPPDKAISERVYKFRCEQCNKKYKKILERVFNGIKEIKCPKCGSIERRLVGSYPMIKKVRNSFKSRLFKEECGLKHRKAVRGIPKKKEDITTGNSGALYGTTLPKKIRKAVEPASIKRKESNFATKTFREEITMGDMFSEVFDKLLKKEAKEKPPKAWFDKTVKALKQRPGITDPNALAGWIWYHHMKGAESFTEAEDGRPPKGWWDRTVADIKAKGYAKDPEAVAGYIWYSVKKGKEKLNTHHIQT